MAWAAEGSFSFWACVDAATEWKTIVRVFYVFRLAAFLWSLYCVAVLLRSAFLGAQAALDATAAAATSSATAAARCYSFRAISSWFFHNGPTEYTSCQWSFHFLSALGAELCKLSPHLASAAVPVYYLASGL